jgi:hypothetical protein
MCEIWSEEKRIKIIVAIFISALSHSLSLFTAFFRYGKHYFYTSEILCERERVKCKLRAPIKKMEGKQKGSERAQTERKRC